MSDPELGSLTEEQRIARLEKKVGQNRLLLTLVTLVIVIGISVSTTVGIIKLLRVDKPYATLSEVEEMATRIETMEAQLVTLQTDMDGLVNNVSTGGNALIQKTLIEQEQSYRTFISTLQVGMVDLAKMVTGSRTWLEIYREQLQEVSAASEAREQALKGIPK